MQQTPFHAYVTAQRLANLIDNNLIPALASSDINIYPYQIAAAEFALRSPYLKGCILCDEGSLGKTFEALLIATQKWYEGKTRQLVILPVNLVKQWTDKIERSFTLPFVLLDNAGVLQSDINPFEQDALVITTYDFAVAQAEYIKKLKWDLIIFDEADCLNKSYLEDNKISTVLKDAANGFKLLLTPTPIEMDIRDIYGLIHFIDESVLPDINDFYARYFRKPENYHELTAWVSKFCFRTLKSQVTEYVNFTQRIPYTISCDFTKDERILYDRLQTYLERPQKLAYPKMDRYDLTLQHCHILSSSPQAYINTIDRALDRLNKLQTNETQLLQEEIGLLSEIRELAAKVSESGKAKTLLKILKKCFARLKQLKAPQKAIIFTDNLTTQKCLYALLCESGYNTLVYSGANSRDYTVMDRFRNDKAVQILLATDEAAKGLDIEFCPIVVNYDMLSNAVELEQRISRCHRQSQTADVVVINLIYKENYADVRYVELINKRVLQFSGIFGLSDPILGNFDAPLDEILAKLRHTADVSADFQRNLLQNEADNKEIVENAENILFTTFTKEIADKVTVTPQYLETEIDKINSELWEVVKHYFTYWNANNNDFCFEIDEQAKTITATNYESLPQLFYYWSNGGSRPYKSQRQYGMAKDFKPHYGRITLSSVLARGIFASIACAEGGTLEVEADIEPCTIAFYTVTVSGGEEIRTFDILSGKTETGAILTDEMCREILTLPVCSFTESGKVSEYWLRNAGGTPAFHELDSLVPVEELKQNAIEKASPAMAEQIGLLKLKTSHAKGKLEHGIDDFKAQILQMQKKAEETPVRIEKLKTEKQLKVLQKDLREQEENLFLSGLKLDTELEKQIAEIQNATKIKAKMQRQFVVQIRNNNAECRNDESNAECRNEGKY